MPSYDEYLRSEEWAEKRKAVFKRSGGKCESCGGKAVQVHHKTYVRIFDEDLDDLQAICLSCHAKEHPDKIDHRFVPQIEVSCQMCPSDWMEVFWEGRTCRMFCPACGHNTIRHHPRRRRRRQNRKAKKKSRRPKLRDMMHDVHAEKYRKRVKRLAKKRRR